MSPSLPKFPAAMTGRADRGGATVLLLAAGLVFVVVGVFGAAVGAARLARQQAGVAADLGALAGAGPAIQGASAACARAGQIAADNGARLVDCRLDGLDLLVTVAVTVTPLPGLAREATASARAGPVRTLAAEVVNGPAGSRPDVPGSGWRETLTAAPRSSAGEDPGRGSVRAAGGAAP